jgi:hypothetical protein
MTQTELCPDCGRDLAALGAYKDFVHLRDDGVPCLPQTEEANLVEMPTVRVRALEGASMLEVFERLAEIFDDDSEDKPLPWPWRM